MSESLLTGVHVVAAVVVVLLLARAGRWVARLLRQPDVIGEITFGLAAGPVVLALGGDRLLAEVMPGRVFDIVRFIGHIGLVLYLVGMVHSLRSAAQPPRGRTVALTTVCSTVIPLAAGGVLALYVLA